MYVYIGRSLARHTSIVTNVYERMMIIEVKYENGPVKAVYIFYLKSLLILVTRV